MAIDAGDRAASAVKDLAGVLHQQGKTREAVGLMQKYRYLFYTSEVDRKKFENLLANLSKQIWQPGDVAPAFFKLFGIGPKVTDREILSLFRNSRRVSEIERHGRYCILKFASKNAAQKTYDSFRRPGMGIRVEWVTESLPPATPEPPRVVRRRAFTSVLFHMNPESLRCIPVEDRPPSDSETDDVSDNEG
ncbi:MAG: hypothetical protein V2I33_24960 [Kangiellaceae bacterium]|jgi:hypothetical protein|nr:hypothetical protein [Kangiellaceae bacterium]